MIRVISLVQRNLQMKYKIKYIILIRGLISHSSVKKKIANSLYPSYIKLEEEKELKGML